MESAEHAKKKYIKKNRINPNLSPWESRKIYTMCYSDDMPSCVFVDRDERSLMKRKRRLDRRRWLQSYMCHGDISMKFKGFRAKITKQSSPPS